MNKLIQTCFFLLIATFGNNAALYADLGSEQIQFSFDEDGRKWKVGYTAKNDQTSITEYVLDNENIENWSELVTTQYFEGIDLPLEKFFDAFLKQLAKSVPENKVQSKVIDRGTNNLFAEWWIQDGSANDQHEWVQIFKDGNHVAILRYTTKKLDAVEAKRQAWESILSKAKLKAPLVPQTSAK